MERISPQARRVAQVWALGRTTPNTPPLVERGLARQAQDHLDHGADVDYLIQVADWMATHQPTWQDLDAAMRFASSPKPTVVARTGHPCVCRGGRPDHGGAPVPAHVRQLVRRARRPRPVPAA